MVGGKDGATLPKFSTVCHTAYLSLVILSEALAIPLLPLLPGIRNEDLCLALTFRTNLLANSVFSSSSSSGSSKKRSANSGSSLSSSSSDADIFGRSGK